jgi:hypothetical protein
MTTETTLVIAVAIFAFAILEMIRASEVEGDQ